MTSWQRHARLGVLLFGTVAAVVVYFGIRERQPLASYGAVPPLEPKAVSECQEGSIQQVSGAREDAVVTYSRCVAYEDGSTKLFDVKVVTKNRDGRVFTVFAKEGHVKGKSGYELSGEVHLSDSTGFALTTDACQFDGTIVRAAGPVAFTKGKMSGRGVGMSYDLSLDLLHIQQGAQIDVSGDKGSLHSTAGFAILDRRQDLLTLEQNVQAVRDSQVTAADRAVARLAPGEDVITFVELRGNARVDGESGAVKSMHARDIDLDYTDDGAALERAVLTGQGAITMSGSGGGPGRQATAETFDITLAADGSLSRLLANGTVVMTIPASKTPARSVGSDSLEGSGGPEGSLTRSRFSGNVVFREGAGTSPGTRVARSRALTLVMSDDSISSALFAGGATFEEDDLRATAAEARYEPDASRLQLSGQEAGALPSVADRRLRVEAEAIDLGLEKRTLDARGKVKTFLNPGAAEHSKPGRAGGEQASRLPGLFAQDQGAHVTSSRLEHDGEGGVAHYSGAVWLWQGDREIRADKVDINQTSGDLIATGSAHSRLVFESGRWDGQASEIRYTDAKRVITYRSDADRSQKSGTTISRLKGPQSDLAGRRIEVILADGENRVDRIEAYDAVTALVDGKTITGQRLTYQAREDRYEVTGTPTTPMTLRESCREMVGNILVFDRSTDTMKVDGRTTRAETKNPCRAPASSR